MERSRDLSETLERIQRGLQDAVALRDPEKLADTDTLRTRFLLASDSLRGAGVVNGADVDSLRSRFETLASARHQYDARATARERLCETGADAARRAGDDRDSSAEVR